LPLINVAYAVVNFTMSNGLSVSPVCPPIVPRIPEMDFIRVMFNYELRSIIVLSGT
jgi:hypothetical protein